ncbi:MAG: hypothetical protein KGH53_01660 [Candidatus Micrarchaeota archaeon]|nr:hypothetical protein [Candidatus Micrarchaeota archaeon]
MLVRSLVEVYKGPQNPNTFSGLVFSSKDSELAAAKIARRGELELRPDDKFYVDNVRVRLHDSERGLATTLLKKLDIRVAYEKVCFFVPEIRSAFKPDFFTNVYINGRMLAIEVHGLEWIQNAKDQRVINDTERYITKVERIKAMYPEVFFMFISNIKPQVLEATFKTKISNISDDYRFVDVLSQGTDEFVKIFNGLLKREDVRIERNQKIWNGDLAKLVEKELEKMRLIESMKKELHTTVFKVSSRP